MDRQGKNTLNTTKSKTTPTKSSDSTTSRLEHSNTDKAEENDIKNNFRRMIEAFKEVMKNSLKEMEEKTNKNWKKSTISLKDPRKNIKDQT